MFIKNSSLVRVVISMNMNKKIFILLFLVISLFIYKNINVYALECNEATSRSLCESSTYSSSCRWISGTCQAKYVAQAPCDDNNIRKVLNILGYLLLIAIIAVPLIIIGLGTFYLYKAVIDKDEKSFGKQLKRFGIRVVTGMFIFFVPTIVRAIFTMSDKLDIIEGNDYLTCSECLLDPTENSRCTITN